MPRPAATSPARAIRPVIAACALGSLAAAGWLGWGTAPWWALCLLVPAVTAAELAVVHLEFGRQRYTLSMTEAALGAALALSTGGWIVVGALLGEVAVKVLRRQPRLKATFNIAQFTLATALATVVAARVGGDVGGAAAGMAVFFLANHGLVGFAVSLTSRRPLLALLRSSTPLAALHTAGNAAIGILAGYLAREAPLGLLGLLVPLALLWSTYDQQVWRTAQTRLFAELARGQEQASDRSGDVSATIVLTAAARMLGGADVEMVLVAEDGPVRYAGNEKGVPQRLRVDPDAFDEPWVLRALGARGITTGSDDGRPFCSAVVGPYDDPLAVLVARRPGGAAEFGRRERRLAEVLVRQAEEWLSVSAPSGPDAGPGTPGAGRNPPASVALGAATAPALSMLRESASRLARLAGSSGDVEDIVQELQLVERAVASLLGAIALAPDPDALAGAGAGTSGDWTTTGLLR